MLAENLSESQKKYRSDYSRRYKEKKRREKGTPKRNLVSNPKFNGAKLLEYLEARITPEELEKGPPRLLLNGIPMDDYATRFINHLRAGEVKRADLQGVDRIALEYDLPLWEIVDDAGCYKEDIRTVRRRRRKSL